ncbi:MAG: bifunctional precorrin-2 dehydrogenase/sirohydrochlorin ferrochelatase [Bryobacteraceae bacterium]|nr:bifunctional precorrin-2 dehydrogenase/sirohydrochlorin ferrochelatase [Bryobacteraceae bacterium]
MQHPFPVFLNLTGRPCVVFGTGPLAGEKTAALKAAGAVVRSVTQAPRRADLEGVFLAVSTLADPTVNRMLSEEASRRRVLFNALDDPANCGFYFPAVHRQGALVVALSTSGQCPALAVRLKEKLATWIGPEYGEFLRLAAAIRDRIRSSGLSFGERRRIWYRVVDSPALDLLRAGRGDEAEQTIEQILGEELGPRTAASSSGQTAEARL